MRNINNQKLDKEAINILYGNDRGCFSNMWKYDIDSLDLHDNKTKLKTKHLGNEIFAICLIATLFSIGFGGSHLIKSRTKGQLIYHPVPQTSSTIRQ